MGFWNLWHCHGGICPVLKTGEMTQPVGVGQDGRLWTNPTGDTTQLTGSGKLHDSGIDQDVGTFDYVITGNIMTVRLRVPATWVSTTLSVVLDGLPDGVTIPYAAMGFVHNVFGDATVTPLYVWFSGDSVGVNNAGVSYANGLVKCDYGTFTMIINRS